MCFPSWKKRYDDPERTAAEFSEYSPLLQTGSGKRGFVCKLWDKVTKVARSFNPATTSPSPSVPDPIHSHPNHDNAPHVISVSEPYCGQDNSGDALNTEPPNQWQLAKDMIDKANATPVASLVPAGAKAIFSEADNPLVQTVPDVIDRFSKILAPLETFNSIATALSDVLPYAKGVLSVFTSVSNMILAQAKLDDDVLTLLEKISEVYSMMTEDERLRVAEIESMQKLFGKMAQQIQQCADFIIDYSERKSAWKRTVKHIVDVRNTTDATIQEYNVVLETLLQRFRDRAVRSILLDVQDIDVKIHHMAEDVELMDMFYVKGAGRNTDKCCLPGTRKDILSEIEAWVYKTGEDEPRIFWLSGTAGKGKSAISHTIANLFHERGGPGACFCFDRTQKELHKNMFTTIARDLADRDPNMRRTLAHALRDDNNIRHTQDVVMQWTKLILPVAVASKAVDAPILIVIDALDESGEPHSRKQILRILAGQVDPFTSQLPANVRILITSRPLDDIRKSLDDKLAHVRHVSMDDPSHVSTESSQDDILLYISDRLDDLRGDGVFDDKDFETLARKSDGLFEWARLACEYIMSTNKAGVEPMDQFKDLIAGTSESDKGTCLLDDMYRRILKEFMPESKKAISRVCSVMGQILASSEPLSMAALIAMRQQIPGEDGKINVKGVIEPLGSLLAGTTDPHTPIRPLHASFYDFLTDESRSKEYYIDVSTVQRGLAFASLRVMESELRFNICSLNNSFLPNSAVPDLEKRVKDSISPQLSYSCRFWGTHVRSTPFEQGLAEDIRAFFNEKRLLFWLEALALMHDLSSSILCLSSVAGWLTDEFMDIGDAIKDTRRFVASFGSAILHSTPHLYLSALPLAPTSTIFAKFAAKFAHIPRVVAGNIQHWPVMEKIIHTNAVNTVVSMSPDGNCIVSGSEDGKIHIWDAHTGEALGVPLQGHTSLVSSVAITPDGTRIVSGSFDNTIRIWDAHTGETLGVPLQGHTDSVTSVAITPDGTRIVSGSEDNTIRIWDIHTGKALGVPLQGHTGSVNSVAIVPDGTRIVSGSHDNTIRIWDAHTGEALGVPLQGHTGYVNSVAIMPDGTCIVSGSFDNTIRIWDAYTGEALGAPLQGHIYSVRSVAITPDGTHIVSGSFDNTIRIWDAHTGEALGVPLQGHTDWVGFVAITPDGTRIVSGSFDNTIRIWDAHTSVALGVLPLQGHAGPSRVSSVAITPDGTRIVSGSHDNTIRIWDAHTGEALCVPLQGHTNWVKSVAITPDGTRIVSGSFDNTIRIWDAHTGEALGVPLQGHTDWVGSVAITPDGTRIVSGSDDNTIRIWDAHTGKALGVPLQGHTESVSSVAITPDGTCIVSGSLDNTIRIWDAHSGEALSVPLQGHTGPVNSVAITPDGTCIMSGSFDNTIRIWDAHTGEALGVPLQGHTDLVRSVAIMPDGTRIVSGSHDNTIRIWDAHTGKALGVPLQGHTGSVNSVAIMPDGIRIVSGSYDNTIRIWDAHTGEASGVRLQGPTPWVSSVATTPDGTRVASGSYDGTTCLLNVDSCLNSPAICFSPNLIHALSSTSSFLQNLDRMLAAGISLTTQEWIVGPEGRLLLWIPIALYPAIYGPLAGTTLVIPNNASQIDLSRFAHGSSWDECRALDT